MAGRAVYADEITKDSSRRCFPQLHSHEGDDGLGPSTSKSSKRWMRAALVLIATRRLRRFPLQRQARTRFRVCAHTICAVNRFKRGLDPSGIASAPDGYGVPNRDLTQLLQDRDPKDLQKVGGVEGLAKQLHTDFENGLDETEEEMHRRREAYGANTYPKKVTKGFWSFVWDACKNTTLNILMACAVVSLATGIWTEGIKEGWYEGTSIGVALLLVIVVTAVSDYKQRLNFQNLNAEKENIKVEVLRAGRRQTVSIFDLVVGDIVPLSMGRQVPADGVLVEGYSLSIDESTMTGESPPVKKDKSRPFLLSGCKVHSGQGTMLVTGVGLNTEWGHVMAAISEDNSEFTPLQVRLNGVATLIGKVGLTVASVVLVILVIRYFAITFKKATGKDRRAAQIIKDMVHVFSIAVTIVVVAVPEGLPLAVTLTLAYSMRKMMADKSLVRKLAACETMGSATTIISDKTGTLTTNKMTVTRACVAGEMMNVSSLGPESLPANLKTAIVQSICLNSNGHVSPDKDGGEPAVTGSPTEAALLTWGLKLGMNFRAVRHENQILHVETFDSEKKRAGVVFKTSDEEAQLHWKGAAEIILELCSHWIDSNGSPQPMTAMKRKEFSDVIEGMAAQALRCIAFAYRPFDESHLPQTEEARSDWKAPDQSLILMAIAGIKDPCRAGVLEAVRKCQRAGVKVRMVTGDNMFTAKAIAAECGILTEGGLVVEGQEFRNWDEPRLSSRALDDLVVIARASHNDKLTLVKALKQGRGDVVALMGDGTDDAPALNEADIGLSMGIAGTEVAKESSDIIILDDNFTSVVKVVRWGRSVYANIQKFIQFQLTVNVVALTINFVAAVSSGEVPLAAVQLLWVNLIMDSMGALALATEAPTDDLMDRNPIVRTEPLITNIMWRNILGQACYQITVLLILTYCGIGILSLKGTHEEQVLERNTIIFNAFVFCQIFNEVNARRPEKLNVFEGIHRNHLFLGVVGATIVFQVVMVTFLNDFADTTRLHVKWWGLCVAIGSVGLPLAALIKCCPVSQTPIRETPRSPSVSSSPPRPRGMRTEHANGDVAGAGDVASSSRRSEDETLALIRETLAASREALEVARRSLMYNRWMVTISCVGIFIGALVPFAIFLLQHFNSS